MCDDLSNPADWDHTEEGCYSICIRPIKMRFHQYYLRAQHKKDESQRGEREKIAELFPPISSLGTGRDFFLSPVQSSPLRS